jgi:hypothetical protein
VAAPLAVLVGKIVPHPAEHAVPPCVSIQVTPLLLGSFVTVAVNCTVPLAGTVTEVGAMEIVTPTLAQPAMNPNASR